jgi:hypothetical protein
VWSTLSEPERQALIDETPRHSLEEFMGHLASMAVWTLGGYPMEVDDVLGEPSHAFTIARREALDIELTTAQLAELCTATIADLDEGDQPA